MIEDFAFWIYNTSFSSWLASTPAIVPLVQSIHILAIAVVMGSMLFINLRILGWAGPRGNVNADLRRFIPAIWAALVILLATGLIMVAAEPVRELMNALFRIKMVLVLFAGACYFALQRKTLSHPDYLSEHRLTAIIFAVGTFSIWILIATLGRWIAFAGQLI